MSRPASHDDFASVKTRLCVLLAHSKSSPQYIEVRSIAKIVPPQLRDKFDSKLKARFVGPFPIVRSIGPNAYEVDLPPSFRAHRTINCECIRPYLKPEGYGRAYQPPPVIVSSEGDFYTPERIIAKRVRNKTVQYLIRWKGYSPDSDTWEPLEHLSLVPQLVTNFESSDASVRKTRRNRKGTRNNL